MANIGAYGTSIPINIPNDQIPSLVDIYYVYNTSRNYDAMNASKFERLDPTILKQVERGGESTENFADQYVEGLYTLQLPLNKFGRKGFYTVYIVPREIPCTILDRRKAGSVPRCGGIGIGHSGNRNR